LNSNEKVHPVIVSLGILWAGCVTVFYLLNNTGYYNEKISVFWGFIIKQIGMN